MATVSKYLTDCFQVTGTSPILCDTSLPCAPFHTLTLHEILDLMPPLDCWAVDGCVVDDDGLSLANGIICGTATAFSDGLYKDKIGTLGFVL
jgi:hypothetical protein